MSGKDVKKKDVKDKDKGKARHTAKSVVKSKTKATTRSDLLTKYRENADIKEIRRSLQNVKDIKVLIDYSDSRKSLLFEIITLPHLTNRAFACILQQIMTMLDHDGGDRIADILNRGMKTSQTALDSNGKAMAFDTTPVGKILTTLRRTKLDRAECDRLHQRLILLLGCGVNADCKSVIEPKQDSKKATDRQIIHPLQIAFRLEMAQIFLAIMFRCSVFQQHGDDEEESQHSMYNLISCIKRLWRNAQQENAVHFLCDDCSLHKFAEALLLYGIPRTLEQLKLYGINAKEMKKRHSEIMVTHQEMQQHSKAEAKDDENHNDDEKGAAELDAFGMVNLYFPPPKLQHILERTTLSLHLTYNPLLDSLRKYHSNRDGLLQLIRVLPRLFNLTQITFCVPSSISNKYQDNIVDEEHCGKLLQSMHLHCKKYGKLARVKLDGFRISPLSMNWLADSIRYWSTFGAVSCIQELSLQHVNLDNDCIEQLFDALQHYTRNDILFRRRYKLVYSTMDDFAKLVVAAYCRDIRTVLNNIAIPQDIVDLCQNFYCDGPILLYYADPVVSTVEIDDYYDANHRQPRRVPSSRVAVIPRPKYEYIRRCSGTHVESNCKVPSAFKHATNDIYANIIFQCGAENQKDCSRALLLSLDRTRISEVLLPSLMVYGNAVVYSQHHGLISCGGKHPSSLFTEGLSSVYQLNLNVQDMSLRAWDGELFSAMVEPRYYASSVLINSHNKQDEKMIVIGGFNTVYLSTMEIFDFSKNEWDFLKPTLNEGRYRCAVCNDGAGIYIAGGFSGFTALRSVEYYDLEQNKCYGDCIPDTNYAHDDCVNLWKHNHLLFITSLHKQFVEFLDLRCANTKWQVNESPLKQMFNFDHELKTNYAMPDVALLHV